MTLRTPAGNLIDSSGNAGFVLYDASGNPISSNINADRTTNLDGVLGLNTNAMIFGRVSDAIVKNLRSDASTESLMIVEYEHHEVHAGTHYFIDDVADLAINNVFDLQWTTPNTTTWSHFTFILECESETDWYIYEGATVINAGTLCPCFNNDRNSTNTTAMTIAVQSNTSLANANADTSVVGATQLRHGIIGSGRGNAGTSERGREVILKQNTVYCMRAIATAAGYINFNIDWYEHANRN